MNDTRTSLTDTDMALRVPLAGVQQIEASAGTGKTYTIAGLYARLVVEQKLETRQLLVMTFTKAASEELRQRLRQRLALCAQTAMQLWLEPHAAEPAELAHEQRWVLCLLRRALDQGDESAELLAQRLRQAVLRMDEAAIFTIHGFCQHVLGEHASLIDRAGSTVELEPYDDDLLETFAADAWLRMGADEQVSVRQAMQVFGSTPKDLARTLKGLVDFGGRIEPAASAVSTPPPAPDTLRDAVVRAWVDAGEAAVQVFETAWNAGHLNKRSYSERSLEQLMRLRQQLTHAGWPSTALLKRFAGSKLAAAIKKDAPAFPDHPAFAAIDAWLEAERAWQAYVQSRLPAVLHGLVREARAWLAVRKRDLARMSYGDQIEWVRHGLVDSVRGARLRQVLHAQYPVALVDEFQDTDARQFAIFRQLYAEAGTLFCIGDPKQAIYGFRGGDVHAYLRARKLADRCWSIGHNYRSAPGLLAACEALFTAREDVFVEGGIVFDPVQSGGRVVDGALRLDAVPVTPLTLWRLPTPAPAGGKDGLETVLAMACAGTIAQLLATGAAQLHGAPLQAGSIAVLVDSNKQAMRVQDALTALGVPAVSQRRESVYASMQAIELCRIFDALLAPRHAGLARGALATHLLGRRLSDLQAMHDTEADWRAELDDLRVRWFKRGVLAMLERLGERHAQRLLSEPGGERCLSNLMQLGDALQAEARRLSGTRAQRDWLVRRMALADAGNENEQLRLESDAERVQIMTVHASKGLEFDLVLLPFAALMQAKIPAKGDFARFHDGNDDLLQRFIVTGKNERSVADAAALDAAQREDLAEGVRKLYVGVTRARHACWLSVDAPAKGRVLDWVLAEGTEALLQRAAPHAIECALPSPVAIHMVPTPSAGTLQARRFSRVLDGDWRRHSFSRLAEGADEDGTHPQSADSSDAAGATVPALATGLYGSRFGSTLHDILEHIDFEAWSGACAAPPDAQREQVSRSLLAQGFVGVAAKLSVEALLQRTLRTPIIDDLCLAALPTSKRRAEMVFDFGIQGVDPRILLQRLHAHGYQLQRNGFAHVGTRLAGLMNGIIDLVFVHEERWWIVDYKSNHLGDHVADYAPAALGKAVRRNDYDLQYLIYTVALHRWLSRTRGTDYDYARDFGGVCYLFLRGMGVGPRGNGIFIDRPPPDLIQALDELLHAPETSS